MMCFFSPPITDFWLGIYVIFCLLIGLVTDSLMNLNWIGSYLILKCGKWKPTNSMNTNSFLLYNGVFLFPWNRSIFFKSFEKPSQLSQFIFFFSPNHHKIHKAKYLFYKNYAFGGVRVWKIRVWSQIPISDTEGRFAGK